MNGKNEDTNEGQYAQLTGRLMRGETAVIADWTAVFETLANQYFASDTAALLRLVAEANQLTLPSGAASQMRRYFNGVAAFRQDAHDDALRIFAALLAEDGLTTHLRARTLNARAVVCRVTGRLDEAIAGYEESLMLWEQLGNRHFLGIVTLNLGIIWYGLRDYEAAASFLRQAESHFRAAKSAVWVRKVQSELGLVQRDLGNWGAALAHFDAYVAESKAAGALEDVGVGEANRGEVLLFMGEIEAAKAALQTAVRLLVSRTYRVDHLIFLGLAHQAEGAVKRAESYYREALGLAQEIGRDESLPHALYHLGDVLRQQGETEEALRFWRQGAEAIEASSEPLERETVKISLLGRWQQIFEALVLTCVELGRVHEAFGWAERARARAFAAAFGVTAVGDTMAVRTALAADETLFSFFTTGVLMQDMPLLRAIPKSNPLRAHILLPAKTIRFMLTKAGVTVQDCELNPNLFATQSPRGFDATRFLKTAVLQKLRRHLLPEETLPPNLIINPHGPLHRVPFGALFGAGERPFRQAQGRQVLRLVPSGTIFAQQRAAAKMPSTGCVAVGFGGDEENGRLLPFAEAEAAMVAEQMNGATKIGILPKKEWLREAAAQCRWLHIACHGWFDDADPLESYLETGVAERLTAREVLATWHLSARLVVLSACETGVSQLVRGDEPLGLVRAFLAAGARAVLVSQWPVDDRATFLLMGRFYELLGERGVADLADLLQEAQGWLRELARDKAEQILGGHLETKVTVSGEERPFAEPVYWAGFVLVGG